MNTVNQRTPAPAGRSRAARGAFTLIELLVVIAVIALLLAVMLPGLAGARGTAKAARELSAAQQMMTAFALYSGDHKGQVLPGYIPALWVPKMNVLDHEGRRLTGPEAQRFPWRLAPWLDYNFRGLYQDDQLLVALRDTPPGYQYMVSLYPSLAMNVEFVGGSAWNGLGFNPTMERLYGRYYITRDDEAQRPTELLVFTSARGTPLPEVPAIGDPRGYYRLDAPYLLAAQGRRWEAAYDARSQTPGANSGYVALRHQNKAVGAMIDGHGALLGWDDLADMRRWANGATGPAWGLEPR